MPPSTIPSIFNAISSPDPRCENSEPMLPRNGKALPQPHDAWPVLALDAYLLRCLDKAGAVLGPVAGTKWPVNLRQRKGRWVLPHWRPNGCHGARGSYPGPGVPTCWVWGSGGGAFDYPFADW